MKKIFALLLLTSFFFTAHAQVKKKPLSASFSRLIAKDSVRLGGVWRSTWPGGGGGSGTGDSTKSWSVYGNLSLSSPLLGTKNNTNVNIIANNKLLLQVNPDSTVKVKSRIPDTDSTQQVSSTEWIKKNIEKTLVFDETMNVTEVGDKTRIVGANLDNLASVTYVDNAINNIVLFSGWALTGNEGTDTAINFIGNSDDVPLLIKSNNQTAAIFTKDTNYFVNHTSLFHSSIVMDTVTQVPDEDADSKSILFKGIGTGNTPLEASIGLDGGGGGGSLGINNPGGQIWINGSSLITPSIVSSLSNLALYINSASGGFIMQNQISQTSGLLLNVYGNGNSRMAIDAVSGNVGIGTTAPDSTLTVVGGIKSTSTVSDANGNVRPYKVYTALLTQTGTDAPTAVVLENTTGITPYITYSEPGVYNIFPLDGYDQSKIYYHITNNNITSDIQSIVDSDNIRVFTSVAGDRYDNILLNTPIEIRIYN